MNPLLQIILTTMWPCLISFPLIAILGRRKDIQYNIWPNIAIGLLMVWSITVGMMWGFGTIFDWQNEGMEKPVVIEKQVKFVDKNTGISLDKPK